MMIPMILFIMNLSVKMRMNYEKDIPYYALDDEGNVHSSASNNEAYIDDDELKELLLDF